VFDPSGPKNIPNAMPDGTTNQVILVERYLNCNNFQIGPAWGWIYPFPGSGGNPAPSYGCATWAGSKGVNTTTCPDYNQGNTGFQVAPTVAGCIPGTLQGVHPSVMMVGMGDGSVRGVSAAVSRKTWELANYPFDGAVLNNDWNQ
jgi:hypothetical protein